MVDVQQSYGPPKPIVKVWIVRERVLNVYPALELKDGGPHACICCTKEGSVAAFLPHPVRVNPGEPAEAFPQAKSILASCSRVHRYCSPWNEGQLACTCVHHLRTQHDLLPPGRIPASEPRLGRPDRVAVWLPAIWPTEACSQTCPSDCVYSSNDRTRSYTQALMVCSAGRA